MDSRFGLQAKQVQKVCGWGNVHAAKDKAREFLLPDAGRLKGHKRFWCTVNPCVPCC